MLREDGRARREDAALGATVARSRSSAPSLESRRANQRRSDEQNLKVCFGEWRVEGAPRRDETYNNSSNNRREDTLEKLGRNEGETHFEKGAERGCADAAQYVVSRRGGVTTFWAMLTGSHTLRGKRLV